MPTHVLHPREPRPRYDKDQSGEVSIDETMTMLYRRHGKDKLEGELQKLFGEDLKTADGDGALNFAEYVCRDASGCAAQGHVCPLTPNAHAHPRIHVRARTRVRAAHTRVLSRRLTYSHAHLSTLTDAAGT